NRNRPWIVDGMIEGVERLSNSVQEMDFLQSGQSVKDRIFEAYCVNPIACGQVQDANRAQAAVATEQFCDTACNPVIELVSQSLTRWVARRYANNLVAWVDPTRASDAELSLKEWATALQFGLVSGNEFRRQILNLEDRPELDDLRDALGN